MIKITKKYLSKIIKEERNRVLESVPWSEESVQGELERADKLNLKALEADETHKPFDEDLEELRKMMHDVAQEVVIYYQEKGASRDQAHQLVSDVLVGAAQNFVEGLHHDSLEDVLDIQYEDDQGEGEFLEMSRYIQDHGPLDDDADLMEKKKMKISQPHLVKIIREEVARVLKEKEEKKPEGKGCAESEGGSGCIKEDEKGWFIWNNKKGGIFKRCKSKKDCEEILSVPGVH